MKGIYFTKPPCNFNLEKKLTRKKKKMKKLEAILVWSNIMTKDLWVPLKKCNIHIKFI